MEILFTIIIPHYNIPHLLVRLLNTIPNIPQIQVIVVDDKSDIKLAEYEECKKEFSNRNIEFYENEEKKSAGTCRNIALRKARGKWLIFADADDYFLEGFYEKIKHRADDGQDIIYYIPTSIVDGSNEVSFRHLDYMTLVENYLEDQSFELLLRVFFNPPWSKMIKRELVQSNNISFDEEKVANDVMFSIKCAMAAKEITAYPEIIYCISLRDASLTTTVSQENFDIRLRVFVNMFSYLKENLEPSEFKKLNLCGIQQLMIGVKNHFGKQKILEVLSVLRKNRIPIFTLRGMTLKRMMGILKNYKDKIIK